MLYGWKSGHFDSDGYSCVLASLIFHHKSLRGIIYVSKDERQRNWSDVSFISLEIEVWVFV